MAKEVKTSRATAETIGVPGRVMVTARERPILIDSSAGRSGKSPEAHTAGETFLASLIGCGAVIVAAAAQERRISYRKATFSAESGRFADNPSQYTYINIDVEIEGVTQPDAEALVAVYQDECPIYGLAKKATQVNVRITAR